MPPLRLSLHVGLLLLTAAVVSAQSVEDRSPTVQTSSGNSLNRSVSGRTLALAAASDGRRLYAATFAGVWRSDDAGVSWCQLTPVSTSASCAGVTNAIPVPNIVDVAVSPTEPNLVLASTGWDTRVRSRDGVYRSGNGGASWSLVKQFDCGGTIAIPSQVLFAPDDPLLVFAAGGCGVARSRDGGNTWSATIAMPSNRAVRHLAIAPRQGTRRRVYAIGDGRTFVSEDEGETWVADDGAAGVIPGGAGGAPATTACNSRPQVLAVEPGNPNFVYLAVPGGANGSSYYHSTPNGTQCNTVPERGCGEGSLWLGDYSRFAAGDPTRRRATWTQLPGPSVYFGGSTPSGGVYVLTKPTPSGFLVFFADCSHVHMTVGRPASRSWHRLDGADPSQNQSFNQLFMHVDPHALAFSQDFDEHLTQSTAPAPFDRNTVKQGASAGTLWMANDGGIDRSGDGGATWTKGRGLSTLALVNIAGDPRPDASPGIYMGTGDNDDYFSLDGGATWGDPATGCGDCDAWFADAGQPLQLLQFTPRPGGLRVYKTSSGLPNPGSNAQATNIPPLLRCNDGTAPLCANGSAPGCTTCNDGSTPACAGGARPFSGLNAFSGAYAVGYRPIIQTLQREKPGDLEFVVMRCTTAGCAPGAGVRTLARVRNPAAIQCPSDWANAEQVGPPLPANVSTVQPSGGHASPVFYVGDGTRLFKWTAGMTEWREIVPGPAQDPSRAALNAFRFFVDPYDPQLIYLLEAGGGSAAPHIKRSTDGGATWAVDAQLEAAVTRNGEFALGGSSTPGLRPYLPLMEMVFDRREPATRFAVGTAGAFMTLDGNRWTSLLDTAAFPSRPVSAFFDPRSNPPDRALYVGLDGRSVVRIAPIPRPGTIFSTSGRIAFLRVHDRGTGFGPPLDFLDAEVIVRLDTSPERAFGFQLRTEHEAEQRAMLDVLRDAFQDGRQVTIEFEQTDRAKNLRIIRVIAHP